MRTKKIIRRLMDVVDDRKVSPEERCTAIGWLGDITKQERRMKEARRQGHKIGFTEEGE